MIITKRIFQKISAERNRDKKLLIIFLIASTCISPAYSIVILVHGSFAHKSDWWKPHGNFFKTLHEEAAQRGHTLIAHTWSGKPTEKAIIEGGKALAQILLTYPAHEEIILIGHSHGGNVINFASQLLYTPLEEILTQQDFTPTTRPADKSLNRAILKAFKVIQEFKATLGEEKTPKKKYLIDKVYLLGTPVAKLQFLPHMSVINYCLNFYSQADYIQPVFGLYERSYPLHERLSNIVVTMQKSKKMKAFHPNHYELHEPIVGQWLLSIPESLKDKKLGNFDQFLYQKNSSIHFEVNQTPVYKI